MGKPRNGHEQVEHELLAEKAATLARITGTLQGHIDALGELRARAEAAAGEEREALVGAYSDRREKAKLWFWYLTVQREALGLRDGAGLAERFPIPPPLGRDGERAGG